MLDEFFCDRWNLVYDLSQHRLLSDDYSDGTFWISSFERDNTLNGVFVESVRAQAVKGLGRENNNVAALESP